MEPVYIAVFCKKEKVHYFCEEECAFFALKRIENMYVQK